jgi:predicted ATPase
MIEIYRDYEYELAEIPLLPVEERVEFVLLNVGAGR